MMLKQLRFFAPLALFVFLVLMFFFALNNDNKEEIPSPLIGKTVPEFELPSLLDGNDNESGTINASIFKNQPMLLNVWASWCPSCVVEHSYLSALASSGVNIIGLNYKDSREDAQQFLTDLGNPYANIIFDEKGSLGLDLGVYGAPETYLISDKGQILAKRVGVMDERVWKAQFETLWLSLTKEVSARDENN